MSKNFIDSSILPHQLNEYFDCLEKLVSFAPYYHENEKAASSLVAKLCQKYGLIDFSKKI